MVITVSAKDFLGPARNLEEQNMTAKSGDSRQVSGNTVFAGDLKTRSLLDQKKESARKQAMKIVSDAFHKDKKLDDEQQEIRDQVKKLSRENWELTGEIAENNKAVDELAKTYQIDPDGEEQQDLELLRKRSLILSGSSKEMLTKEDMDRIREIEARGLTEYQSRSVEYFKRNEPLLRKLNDNKTLIEGSNAALAGMKLERLKTHDAVDARNAADEVREAAAKDIMNAALQGGMEHIDQVMKEKKKEAKEKKEEKEEKEEKVDALREKKAQTEQLAENLRLKNAETEAKEAHARRKERRESRVITDIIEGASGLGEIQKQTENAAAQGQVNTEIQNILNKLSLLNEDIKGAKVDAAM